MGATANAHVFDAAMTVVSPAVSFGRIPIVPTDDLPPSWISSEPAARRRGIAPGREPAAMRGLAPGRTRCAARSRSSAAAAARTTAKVARVASRGSDRDGGRREPGAAIRRSRSSARAAARSRTSTASGSGRRWPGPAARCRSGSRRELHEVPTTWAGVPTSFSAGGLTAVRARAQAGHHRARREHHLVDASRERRRPVLDLGGDELLRSARRRRRGAPPPAPSELDSEAGEVGADVDRGTRVRGLGADAGGVRARGGRRSRARRRAPTGR